MGRRIAIVFAGALVALLATASFGETAVAASKTVTKTFSNPGRIRIVDQAQAEPYPSKIDVGNLEGARVLDVDLRLRGLTHNFPDDVDVLLVNPSGRKNALVMSDAGGSFPVRDVNLYLRDESVIPLPDEGPLESGTYFPTNYSPGETFPSPAPAVKGFFLSVFDGTNPNGTWKLYVFDDNIGFIVPTRGRFSSGWSLRITASLPG